MIMIRSRYLITGSSGSKYVKIWKISQESDLESTEVKELQILRDHTDYLSVIKVRPFFKLLHCKLFKVFLNELMSKRIEMSDIFWEFAFSQYLKSYLDFPKQILILWCIVITANTLLV
jgi:hypothetical protein